MITTRCRACQLQLCKSRDEPPHAGLQASELPPVPAKGKPWSMRETGFTCQTCGTNLVHSTDYGEPGWRKLAA